MITKTELMNFLKFLRSKENVTVDPYIGRTCFTHGIDRTNYVHSLVKVIENSKTDDEAYKDLALNLHNKFSNSEHKLFPFILYLEDMYDYLVEIGYSSEGADNLAYTIANGEYKYLCKRNSHKEYLKDDLHKFALACKCLPHRMTITKLLHTEYENFVLEN